MSDIWKNWPHETIDVRLQAYLKDLAENVAYQSELNQVALTKLLELRGWIAAGRYTARDVVKANALEEWLRSQL